MNLNKKIIGPTLMVIFGGSGDLAKRKLIPALYNLYLEGWLPEKFALIGSGRTEFTQEQYCEFLKEGVEKYSRSGIESEKWEAFKTKVSYLAGGAFDEELYTRMDAILCGFEDEWQEKNVQRIFYLSVAPFLMEPIASHLGKSRVCANIEQSRLVIEKPFGKDLDSAKELNRKLLDFFSEDQLYRIDHYLGKEPVQNLLAFRFANSLFEPLWNRNYIDHVEITVGEDIGIGDRGGYYNGSGALRDMVQNHLLQVLCMVAMEAPINFEAREIRDKKSEVLRAVRPLAVEEVENFVVRGQYGYAPGINSYREEEGVPDDSSTETFVAWALHIDNWRWHGVPFYMRTGKRMPRKTSYISIQFKSVPIAEFQGTGTVPVHPNRIFIQIQPDPEIRLLFYAKKPGLKMELKPVDMRFEYDETYDSPTPEAYETLLLDAMAGNAALYMRADQVELAWQLMMPILTHWQNKPLDEQLLYTPGSWGPRAAQELLYKSGRSWHSPIS
ncbi:MAG: glucose-6-phosphate dehydrogenase [Bacteroidota bacterium]